MSGGCGKGDMMIVDPLKTDEEMMSNFRRLMELEAEVAGLTETLSVTLARAERAEAECDNLRARVAELEAGQGWRSVDDLDLDRDIEAEIMMRATFQHEYGAWDARSINILRSDVDFWRPAPPQ